VPPHYRGLFVIPGAKSGLLAQKKIRQTNGSTLNLLHQRPLVETRQQSLPLFNGPMPTARAGPDSSTYHTRNNPELISETSDTMANFAGVEKFFAHITFEAFGAAGYSCRTQFSTRQILNAKLPEPSGGSTVEQSDYED
jgi:hypothetical protein